jgi:hypothetical protein
MTEAGFSARLFPLVALPPGDFPSLPRTSGRGACRQGEPRKRSRWGSDGVGDSATGRWKEVNRLPWGGKVH